MKKIRQSPGFCLRNALYAGGYMIDAPEWASWQYVAELCRDNNFDHIEGVSGSMTEIIGDRSGIYVYKCNETEAHAIYFKHRAEIDTSLEIVTIILF